MNIEIIGYYKCSRNLIEAIATDLHMWSDCILGNEEIGTTYCLGDIGITLHSDSIALSGTLTNKGSNFLLIVKGRLDQHRWTCDEGGSMTLYLGGNDVPNNHILEFETWQY